MYCMRGFPDANLVCECLRKMKRATSEVALNFKKDGAPGKTRTVAEREHVRVIYSFRDSELHKHFIVDLTSCANHYSYAASQ